MGFGKGGKGVIITDEDIFTLATLGSGVALKQDTPLVLTEDFRMLKAMLWLSMNTATFVDGDGPLIVGICSNELSATELGEAMKALGPLGRDDRLREERATRPVFPMWQIEFSASETVKADLSAQMPLVAKQQWTYPNPAGWALFVYNMGSSGLTDGGFIRFNAKYFGVWVT